MNLRPRFGG